MGGEGMTVEEQLKAMAGEDGFIYTRDVVAAGIRKEKLREMLTAGVLMREARGIYSLSDQMTDEFTLIQVRCKKGVYSHETALYFYGLTDQPPLQIEMTIPTGYCVNRIKENFPHLTFHRIKEKLWRIGMKESISPQGGRICLYNKERCICDMIREKEKSDPQVFKQSITEYFGDKNRDSIRLMEYAKQLGLTKKIREYMEMLT